MSVWENYPSTYRSAEVGQILQSVMAGDCVSVIGLSGSGKSNLLGFIAHRVTNTPFVLVDCNKLENRSVSGFFRHVCNLLSKDKLIDSDEEMGAVERALNPHLTNARRLCLLLDRFDSLFQISEFEKLTSNLRALRDTFKYQLTYALAMRKPLDPKTELAELFYGHTIWLGPLSRSDALWSVKRDATRLQATSLQPNSIGIDWRDAVLEKLVDLSWGYPAMLRAACEAYAAGAELNTEALRSHPAVRHRVDEFWADLPDEEAIINSKLEDHPLLVRQDYLKISDTSNLTAKENLLLAYLSAHQGQVCEKDDLIQAVWPEDVIFQQGVRDESLAQVIRRLRVKIEPNPGEPRFIFTVPGRGYIFREGGELEND